MDTSIGLLPSTSSRAGVDGALVASTLVSRWIGRRIIAVVAGEATDRDMASRIGVANYRWTCTTPAAGAEASTAEQWLRRVWEDAPTGLRIFLRFGWRFGLGLRLGPADPWHVLGWRIDASADNTVTVSASSPILSAQNTLTSSDALICWRTDVFYNRRVGRLVWVPAALLHQRIVPWSVRRAIRSQG